MRADQQTVERAELARQTSAAGPKELGKGAEGQQERGRPNPHPAPSSLTAGAVSCMTGSPAWESGTLEARDHGEREALLFS